MTDPEANQRAASLYAFALDQTQKALSKGSVQSLERVLDKLHRLAQGRDSSDATCARCKRGQVATALISELVAIQGVVNAWDEEEKQLLRAAGEKYSHDSEPLRAGESSPTLSCPFDRQGSCILKGVRPFSSYFGPGVQNDTGLPCEMGHATALTLNGLDHHRVELGLAILRLLDDPSWPERYMRGEHCLWDVARIPPVRDPILEQRRQATGHVEAIGAPSRDPEVIEAELREPTEGVEGLLDSLPQDTVLRRVLHLRIPSAVRSEDEVEAIRKRFLSRLRSFVAMTNDPAEVFDALRHFHLFPLPYQGREVKSILSEVANTLFLPTVAKATPDLVVPIDRKKAGGRIKVGYLSGNFRRHNGAHWSLGWIRNHGQDIDSYVFSISPETDRGTLDFRKAADHFYELPGEVPAMARFIKSLNLDALIFPDIGMDLPTSLYASMRLAPLQAAAWGHPVTTGLPTIDYYLSSDWMEPEHGQEHYTEQLVRLPESGLYLEPTPEAPSILSRADLDLPGGSLAVVLQNPMKLIPEEDVLFAELSERHGGDLVFLEGKLPWVNHIVRSRLEKAGVRAHWLPFLKEHDFLRLIQLADVIIDVPAWNGGNTTLHAIQLGKPVVSLAGEFMRGRHALAFLRQASMEMLIAKDREDFCRIACDPTIQEHAAKGANPDGPFRSLPASAGLDDWIRSLCIR
jgi:hypothetical protein